MSATDYIGRMSAEHSHARSCCPVTCTLDILGDRWTLVVLRDLFLGRTTFKEFVDSPEGIATNILSERLRRLVEAELVEKRQAPTGRRMTYHLTPKGQSLLPVLQAVRDWGLANIPGTEARRGAVT